MTDEHPSIIFDHASVEFAGRTALTDVSITLAQRRIGVIGANGSGKSTFARMLNGLVAPTTGKVFVHDREPTREGKEVRRRVGFVFSNPDAQIIMPTVAEDVAFSLRNRGFTKEEIAERTSRALDRFGLTALADAPAHDLSSGQKQLLAVAAILITEPSLIVADEPTAMLDAVNSRRIASHLLDDGEHQLVLVTHDLALAARCDVVLLFERSRLVDHGNPVEVISAYERTFA